MEKLVIANWKAYLTKVQSEKWLVDFSAHYQPVEGVRVVLAVPFPFLADLHQKFKSLPNVSWAAQDISPFPIGSYTGSVPAAWLTGLADYVLVGHRERRQYFRENIQDVANKVSEALEEEIIPVLCVDMGVARQQAASVEFEDLEKMIVAYTPSDAEQLEISRNKVSVSDGVDKVSALFHGAPILYGGGVDEGNVAELFSLPGLSGVMVARGCLDPLRFVKLLENASESLGLR